MGWGTYYKYNGKISRVGKDELQGELQDQQDLIDMWWREILAYAATSPPLMAEDCEGSKYPWPEFIASKIDSLRRDLEEAYQLKTHIEDCLETLTEHPENVSDPNDYRDELLKGGKKDVP